MQVALRTHDELLRAAIERHEGHVFKTIGDAFCAAFARPESAAAAALAAQRALGHADFSAVDGLRVRMALELGTADERDGDFFGPTVNRVARLLALGHGGQILLSAVAARLVRENPPPDATVVELGTFALDGFERQEHVHQLVAPELQREFPELRAKKAARRLWLVPAEMRTRYFTGRETLLARVREQLARRHRAVLSGLGGVGKTQTALEYAVRFRDDYPHGVYWIAAETVSGLTGGFVEIAAALGLPGAASNDQEQAVRATVDWLNGHDGWLLLLDNVSDRRDVLPYVPQGETGDVLITSRESVFAEVGIARAIEVRDLESDESMRFLLARTGRAGLDPGERSAASELAAELGNLPLALEQAAAYLTETGAGFAAYLGAFRKRRLALLERSREFVSRDTVAVTWAANFEAVERVSAAAAEVLRASAFLGPDDIPFELLLTGAEALGSSIAELLADADDLAVPELLLPLARYSLVRSDALAHTFGVHRLVQEIVRDAIAPSERPRFVERLAGALDAAFPDVQFSTWAQCERLVRHVAAVAGWAETCGIAPAAAARVLRRAGRYFIERGRYDEAQTMHERGLAIAERAHGPDHPDVAAALNGVGSVHLERGRYHEAQPFYVRALETWERTLGPEDPATAIALNNLGLVQTHLGRYEEAKLLHERALEIRERALGADDPYVANTLNNIGHVLVRLGRYAEAQRMCERSLDIRERRLGPHHPVVGLSSYNVASLWERRGNFVEARRLHERALQIFEGALGAGHEDFARSLEAVANLERRDGKLAESEALYARAFATLDAALDHGQDNRIRILEGFAKLKHDQGRYDEAASLYQQALAIQEEALGPEHPDLTICLGGLARAHVARGDYVEAEALVKRAIAIRERAFGGDHPDLSDALAVFAALRRAQGRIGEARQLLERAVQIWDAGFAPGHPDAERLRRDLTDLRAEASPA